MTIDDLLVQGAPPIVAILRGVKPEEIGDIAGALVSAGIRMIEVPLNSPYPYKTIENLVRTVGDIALCGAGTVLEPTMVDAVAEAGGRLIVTPNTQPAVIERAVALGLQVMPGFMTPTEAFTALRAGAKRLKLFPAHSLGPSHLKAVREVLPGGTGLWAVGGVSLDNLDHWLDAGAEGVAVGSTVYRPGDDARTVGSRAAELVTAWRLKSGRL
jgi:2-dehydro-3-deoxyphosphogalactonate aldolase